MNTAPRFGDAFLLRDLAPAIHSSARFVEEHVAPKRCDSEAVADCWRCNTVFLSRTLERALAALPAEAKTCGCIADEELGAGSVCPVCGHRDHGRSGCKEPDHHE